MVKKVLREVLRTVPPLSVTPPPLSNWSRKVRREGVGQQQHLRLSRGEVCAIQAKTLRAPVNLAV